MAQQVDLSTWPRAEQFRFFRTFDRPHYAITTRLDVTHLMALKSAQGLSPFRTCVWAIGAGFDAVPELRMRFRDDVVTVHPSSTPSSPILREDGSFRFGYFAWTPDRTAFDIATKAEIEKARSETKLNPESPNTPDVAYVSCLPWLDYTSLDNALPQKDDCIPRVSWGKIVPKGSGYDMAMTIQVHHALVDGYHVGQYFEATQDALNRL